MSEREPGLAGTLDVCLSMSELWKSWNRTSLFCLIFFCRCAFWIILRISQLLNSVDIGMAISARLPNLRIGNIFNFNIAINFILYYTELILCCFFFELLCKMLFSEIWYIDFFIIMYFYNYIIIMCNYYVFIILKI